MDSAVQLLLLFTCLTLSFKFNQADDGQCKFGGTLGHSPPIITSLVKQQSGYSAAIEIVQPSSGYSVQVEDVYNEVTKIGSIVFTSDQPAKSIYYYRTTKEVFIINDGSTNCQTLSLDSLSEQTILSEWMTPQMNDYLTLLKPTLDRIDQLGPTLMMIIASSFSTDAYDIGEETLDGLTVNHWSACVSPADSDLAMDFYFLAHTNMPYRLEIYHQNNPDEKTLFNFLTFNPILSKIDQLIAYPLSFGCKRLNEPKVNIPVWASADTYYLEMEAALSFVKPDRFSLTSVKAIKYQNVYSYEITESNTVSRTILTPTLINYYKVDPITGQCSIDYREFFDFTAKIIQTQWPVSLISTVKYNLLDPTLYNLDFTNYLGQVDSEYGKMDIFEGIIQGFYKTNQNQYIDALIQYHFPVFDTIDKRNQPPHHILIKPYNLVNDGLLTMSIPNQIEITIVDYAESDINYDDYFDISGCYDETGQYTWFQLVFPDTSLDIARYQEKDLSIYKAFESMVSTIIPKLRLPEIRVNIFGPNIYITGKLLEAESFNFISNPTTVLSNPTRIVIREYLEDCSQLCLDSDYCPAYAHCSNMQCYLFTSKDSAYDYKHSDNCTLYISLDSSSTSSKASTVDSNLLKSTKNLLHQLNTLMNRGELILPNLKLSAGDLFIVNGPDEIGGVDEEYSDLSSSASSFGDDFIVIQPNQRFTSEPTRTLGVTYQSCLSLCDNDDDCLTLSYCPSPLNECVMSNKTTQQVQQSYRSLSSYVDGCHILSKSFLAFYRKLEGRSLVIDAVSQVKNVEPSNCAQICSQSTDFDCKSFDYCPQIANSIDGKIESACFLHTLHVATDTAHELTGNVWDFSNAECDHYSRKLSKDYQHFLGKKLNDKLTFIETLEDASLEFCASRCSSENTGCTTFEYCEVPGNTELGPLSTCRLTRSYQSTSNLVSSSSTDLCSVYVNKDSFKGTISNLNGDETEGGLGMAMALGAFFFISAFAIGIIASHLYIKKSS